VVTLIYQSLRERLPGLRIQVHYSEDTAATLVDDVDLLLHFGPRLTTGAWVTRVLHPVHEVLLASPAYLERAGLPTHPEELAGHDLLFWRGPCSDGPALPLRSGGLLPVSPLLESSDAYTLRLLARAGLGLAWLPEGRVPDPEEEPGALVPVLPELIGRECPLRMAVPEALAHAPRIQRLLALIGEHLQENG
jgi:DNA-binding transcriptional LysR family regulator